jgi:hypothetical protein
VVAQIRDVGDMRDHHERMKPRAGRPRRVEESLTTASSWLLKTSSSTTKPSRVALAGDPVGDGDARPL